MTNFSLTPGHCQLLFFKPAGKWKYEEVLDMSAAYNDLTAVHAVALSIGRNEHLTRLWRHHWALVIEPYHRNAVPVLLPPTEMGVTDLETIQSAVRYNNAEFLSHSLMHSGGGMALT